MLRLPWLPGIISDKEGSKTAMKPTAILPVVIKYGVPFAGKKGTE
jgi:hypothetical protein